MITPTVGRVIWYRPGSNDDTMVLMGVDKAIPQPLAAFVIAVHPDGLINLHIIDSVGSTHTRYNVKILADHDAVDHDSARYGYAQWMPYQIGQAKAHENPFKIGASPLPELNKDFLLVGQDRGLSAADIARVCHEVNRGYCEALGEEQPSWENAPQWQKDSAMLGVKLHTSNPDAGAEASHESWLKQKVADGWEYGPVKVPSIKQHPCMVPFNQLPPAQQAKDYIFRAVVHALT